MQAKMRLMAKQWNLPILSGLCTLGLVLLVVDKGAGFLH